MASNARIIGRRRCGFCDFEHAHVKQADGKHCYCHCPNCGIVVTARSHDQARYIQRGMRPVDASGAPVPPATDDPIVVKGAAAPASPEEKAPAAPPKRAGLWDQLMGGSK